MIELDLRDIHLPAELPWWPLAPGWWLLFLLLLILLVLTVFYWRRHRSPLRKASLRELSRLRAAYTAGASKSDTLAEISMLLRRVAISMFGRKQVAGISGRAWRDCLENLSPGSGFDEAQLDLLTCHRFRPGPDYDIEQLLQSCDRLIRNLSRERKHVST